MPSMNSPLPLVVVKRGGNSIVLEDLDGVMIGADWLALAVLVAGRDETRTEDGRDVFIQLWVDVDLEWRVNRGCSPAPRSYSQGGDPGEAPSIEFKASVSGCPELSMVLERHFRKRFLREIECS